MSTVSRAEYISGLRALTDALEQNPDLPLPTTDKLEWQFGLGYSDEERRAKLAAAARLMPCRLDKNDPNASDYNAKYYVLSGRIHGLPVELWAEREMVCTRTVVGSRRVPKLVPAPDAPMVEVVETEEIVRWECTPLLAEATS